LASKLVPWPNCGVFVGFLGASGSHEHIGGVGRTKSSDRRPGSHFDIFWQHRRPFCSCFRTEGQREARHYAEWLSANGFEVKRRWFGYGYRSNASAVLHLQKSVDVEVQGLRLCDPRLLSPRHSSPVARYVPVLKNAIPELPLKP
jgi:hypothetical protein